MDNNTPHLPQEQNNNDIYPETIKKILKKTRDSWAKAQVAEELALEQEKNGQGWTHTQIINEVLTPERLEILKIQWRVMGMGNNNPSFLIPGIYKADNK